MSTPETAEVEMIREKRSRRHETLAGRSEPGCRSLPNMWPRRSRNRSSHNLLRSLLWSPRPCKSPS